MDGHDLNDGDNHVEDLPCRSTKRRQHVYIAADVDSYNTFQAYMQHNESIGGDEIGRDNIENGDINCAQKDSDGGCPKRVKLEGCTSDFKKDNEDDPHYFSTEIEKKLVVGSNVDDLEQAFLLYCEYGRCKGFSVRKGGQRYIGNSRDIRWKEYRCSCSGLQDTWTTVPIYQKQVTRTDCNAKIRVSRAQGGSWRVIYFEKIHNHELVPPSQSYLLRSCRRMSHARKGVLEAMHAAGIGVSRAFKFMEIESGGPQNVSFTRKDAYAHIASLKKQTKVENGDAVELLQFFIKKCNVEPFFYYDVAVDDDGRLMNFLFRDIRCAVDYDVFGDVLSVDTTFKTNKYNLVCAPFVGINHHINNVMFGMGFLSDEQASSFKWLFHAFLESMNEKQLRVVFTDQCSAMMKAIDKVFPNAAHRLCQWHINQNAPSHFGSLNDDPSFKRLWHTLMTRVETEDEFEQLWNDMLRDYELTNHKWLLGMYKIRRRWASIFTHTIFTEGLLATSRSEVTNKVFKELCSCTTSLAEFVKHFEQIIGRWRQRESAEDTRCIWLTGQFVRNNDLLIHAASVYTRNVYKSFEFEVANSFNVILGQEPVDGTSSNLIFKASSTADGSHTRTISYDSSLHHATCSCRMWEKEEILCRHISKVFYVKNVMSIPESLVLKRWTKLTKQRNWLGPSSSDEPNPNGVLPFMTFVNQMMRHFHELCALAEGNKIAQEYIVEGFDKLRERASGLVGTPCVKRAAPDHRRNSSVGFSDPAKVRDLRTPKKRGQKGVVVEGTINAKSKGTQSNARLLKNKTTKKPVRKLVQSQPNGDQLNNSKPSEDIYNLTTPTDLLDLHL